MIGGVSLVMPYLEVDYGPVNGLLKQFHIRNKLVINDRQSESVDKQASKCTWGMTKIIGQVSKRALNKNFRV